MRPVLAGIVAALITSAACQLPGTTTACPQIDWVDFVQLGSTQYVAGIQSPGTIDQSQLGPVIAHVKFRVEGHVCDPSYRPKDGDAAFLDPGVAIYAVNGQPTTQVVAAPHDGRFVEYWAFKPSG